MLAPAGKLSSSSLSFLLQFSGFPQLVLTMKLEPLQAQVYNITKHGSEWISGCAHLGKALTSWLSSTVCLSAKTTLDDSKFATQCTDRHCAGMLCNRLVTLQQYVTMYIFLRTSLVSLATFQAAFIAAVASASRSLAAAARSSQF